MAQRLAMLLVLASVVVIALADIPSAEVAKYKEHEKHEKDYDHKAKHEEKYNKPSYSHKEHNKPGYSHEEHYASPPYAAYGEHPGYEHPPHYYSHEGPYEHTFGYDHYDGGYWGGSNGRQVIRLQAVYPEKLLDAPDDDDEEKKRVAPLPCSPANPGRCKKDFGLTCGLRHHEQEPYGSYGSEHKSGPIFETSPTTPIEIARGFVRFVIRVFQPLLGIKLVTFNAHQKGYKVGEVNGYIKPTAAATSCHALLGEDTSIEFFDKNVPVYLIIGKVELPVDPAIVLPLGGIFISERQGKKVVNNSGKVMGEKPAHDEYKTTPEGNKYKTEGSYVYVLNEKDNTLCGLSLVARGDVTVKQTDDGVTSVFDGSLEWPILWTDLVTTMPLLIRDEVDGQKTDNSRTVFFNFDLADVAVAYVGAVIDRFAAVCKANPDVPFITPASFTLDVSPRAP